MLFLSGAFLGDCLPRDKGYVYHYFKTEVARRFICYVHVMGNFKYFTDHTGHRFCKRSRQVWLRTLRKVEQAHAKARSDMDFDTLERIEKGLYR